MADQELRDLPEETDPGSDDLVYVVTDPDGTAADRKVKLSNLPGSGANGVYVEMRRTTAQSIPNDATTTVTYTAVEHGATWADAGTGEITPPAGVYVVTFTHDWDANATGSRIGGIYRNGSIEARVMAGTTFRRETTITALIVVEESDVLTGRVYHDQGSALNLSGANTPIRFKVARVGGV